MKNLIQRWWPLGGLVLAAAVVVITQLPGVSDSLLWRMDSLRADIKYALNPPEAQVFSPGENQENSRDTVLPTRISPSPSPTLLPTLEHNPTGSPSGEKTLAPTLTPSPTPLPSLVALEGIEHEYQKYNNCGPANLAMSLSYWGWEGDQNTTAAFLKPNQRDKNVMPYEMTAYVNQQTSLKAVTRIGGSLDLLKALLAGGFPVILETGFDNTLESEEFIGWMGHYEVVNAYDDAEGKFYFQDSYLGPRISDTYQGLQSRWRAFNYTMIITYPPDREAQLFEILGPYQDPVYASQQAAALASAEIYQITSPRAKYFAWFNRGSSLAALDDYQGAAEAFDQAFSLYLEIPEKERPWRMMWYQTGPYWAYYYTGRYYDVINLATQTIETASEPAIEESWYWRALAREALGDRSGALADLRKALDLNPEFETAAFHLDRILES